jgi:hypothetical protein
VRGWIEVHLVTLSRLEWAAYREVWRMVHPGLRATPVRLEQRPGTPIRGERAPAR